MGWNAGGYGTMRFASRAALDAWRAATIDHGAWRDWPGELAHSFGSSDTVAKTLAAIAKRRSKDFPIEEVRIDGLDVELTYDDGEDGFRDSAGEIAALVRCADAHGAKGTFFFLGTAGAEHDFAYEIVLDGKKSKAAALKGKALARAYGPDYEAYQKRVETLFAAANPEFRALLEKGRTGEKPRAEGGDLQARIMEGLAGVSDGELAAIAKKFPGTVPSPMGPAHPKNVFKANNVRELLGTSEDMRAVALWAIAEQAHDVGVFLAFEVLGAKNKSQPMECAAIRALGHATGGTFEMAFGLVRAALHADALRVAAAQGALMAFDRDELVPALAKLLPTLANIGQTTFMVDPAIFVLKVIERRNLGSDLQEALALFAKRERKPYVKKLAEKLTRALRKARAPRSPKRSRSPRRARG